jgi:hypothetical protein
MPRYFDDLKEEYLYLDTTDYAASLWTNVVWFNSDNVADAQSLCFIGRSGVGGVYHVLKADGAAVGNPLRQRTWGSATVFAESTTGYSANTWHHACGVLAADNDRRVYIDGGSEDIDNTNSTTAGEDRIACGGSADDTPRNYVSGSLMWWAIWQAALTTTEIARLGGGAEPVFVRRDVLKFFARLMGDEDFDIIGSRALTQTSTSYSLDAAPGGATWAAGTAQLAIAGGHNILVGDKVTVAGVDDSDYDGIYTITAVTGTTMDYELASVTDATSGSGTVQAFLNTSTGLPSTMIRALPRGRGRDRHRFT